VCVCNFVPIAKLLETTQNSDLSGVTHFDGVTFVGSSTSAVFAFLPGEPSGALVAGRFPEHISAVCTSFLQSKEITVMCKRKRWNWVRYI
jgi:hypothetical protein